MTPETRSGRGDNLIGSMLERRYRVDSLIARGGMSAVYRGLDTRLHRPVAIKVMDSRYSSDRSFIERFEREAQVAASLHHPHVVAVYDQGVDHEGGDDRIYLVMQLVEGCTLRDLLRDRGALPLPLALSVLEPVLEALATAHRAGMVHRDIKPENVLIGQDGSVMVADFGLVRAAASAGTTSGSVILGTVAYLSPEQVTTGAADARTDIYAAGVVLYEMLTGVPPYTGDTALSVAYRHVNDDVPAPGEQVPELPSEVDALVLRATRRDADARPEDAEMFLTEVRGTRSHLGIQLVPVLIPASEQGTERTPVAADGPPTEQFAATGDEPVVPGGPQGTMAMSRPSADGDETQDLPAVPTDASTSVTEHRRNRRTVAIWTVLVLALAGLIGAGAWWLGSARDVTVPKIVGKPEAMAINQAQQAGLEPKVTRQYHNSVQEGTVISSNPAPGSQAGEGSPIELAVSKGLPKVPAVKPGSTVDEVERLLRNSTLKPRLDTSADEYHTMVPKGRVIGVDPSPGTRVRMSTEITVSVSLGPPPVPVPDVRGASKENAFETLRNAGFEPYVAGERFNSDVDGNHVISTDPQANTEVRLKGRPQVGVVLSNAVKVPNMLGMSVQDAQQKLTELGLTAKVQSLFNNPDSTVLTHVPFAGSRVKPGSEVTLSAL